MTLWWCLLGREWNVSFLTLQARSPDTRSQSWCKLLSDDCLSIVLHIPLSAGCPFTIQVTSGNSFTTQARVLPELALLSAVPCSFAFDKIQTSDLPCQIA